MTTREFYESIGASYDSVLVRFGSEKMITKFAPSKAFVAILALMSFTRRAMTLQRILGTVSCQAMSRIMKRSAKNIR